MQTMQRWGDLQLLLALQRSGSLSGASRLLGVHVSTIGRRLDSFEEELGVRLFDRTPDGVLATAAAEKLAPWAEEVEKRIGDVDRVLDGLDSDVSGEVRLSAPPGVASDFIAPLLGTFFEAHPSIRLRIDASIGYADLTRRESDLALRAFRPTSGDLVAKRVGQSQGCVLASKELAHHVGVVDDLEELRWITYSPELAHIPDAAWIRTQVSEQSLALQSDSIHTQISAARTGLACMFMAQVAGVQAGLHQVQLSPRLAKACLPMPNHELWLVGHRALRNVPRIRAVWEFFAEALAQES